MGAEAVGIGERTRFSDAAPARHGLEVADVRALLPCAPARLDQAADVELVEPLGLGSIRHQRETGRPCRTPELLAHDVGGDVLRARRLERARRRALVLDMCATSRSAPRSRIPRTSST